MAQSWAASRQRYDSNIWTCSGCCVLKPLLWLRLLVLLGISALPGVHGVNTLEPCPVDPGSHLELQQVVLSPEVPEAGGVLSVYVKGVVSGSSSINLANLDAQVLIWYCRRIDDCLLLPAIERFSDSVCKIANITEDCSEKSAGEAIEGISKWQLPFVVIRGFYKVQSRMIDSGSQRTVSCYVTDVILTAHTSANKFYDYRDAFVAFAVAASSSRALGKVFPKLSGGLLPQITGFLMIGVVVGPYVTNLVSRYNIFLIGRLINRLSLAFIAGAAGAEIFMPDLYSLLAPMLLQVALITVSTLVFCCGGLLLIACSGIVAVPVLDSQPSFMRKFSISLLTAALMTARSPASAIAVIAELQCSSMRICKVILGITVLGDVVVLIMFALCTNFARVTTEGGSFGPSVFLSVSIELALSGLLGFLSGQALRLVLPYRNPETSQPHIKVEAVGIDLVFVILRGFVLIAILFATYMIAETAEEWSRDSFRLEPLLACTVASCICGHDTGRRVALHEAIFHWTPIVLLPFFTLAGASLQLDSMSKVISAACVIVVLRMLGVATGSIASGLISARSYPELDINRTTVNFTWTTLLAQAGVTLGLVLEVQSNFPGWGHDLAILVIGVVVLNQLLGPVMCRVGLRWIVDAEPAYEAAQELTSGSPSDGENEESPRKEESSGRLSRQSSAKTPLSSVLSKTFSHGNTAEWENVMVTPLPEEGHASELTRRHISMTKERYGLAVYGALLE